MYYLLGWKLLGNDTKKVVNESVKLRKRKPKGKQETEKPGEVGKGKPYVFQEQRAMGMEKGHFTTGQTFQVYNMY